MAAECTKKVNVLLRNRFVVAAKEHEMEGQIEETVHEVIKAKAPEFYARLSSSGELRQLIYISAVEVGRQVRGRRWKENWDQLPGREMVRRLEMAQRQAAEDVLVVAQKIYDHPN